MLAFVAEHHATSGTWPSASQLKTISGSNPAIRAARDALVKAGRLVELPRPGRGGGSVYAIPEVTS
ncbi:hypothetical protein AB3K78_11780 [Leucobacter sp. HNU]|uniref:hypothetical protein n=1 Tax=Leucobacter sp. HNU TaxID=3236805 RepID=UPI003A80FFB6